MQYTYFAVAAQVEGEIKAPLESFAWVAEKWKNVLQLAELLEMHSEKVVE
jgi:hypothetical protein